MSHKGYSLEHEVEQCFVSYADQTFDVPYSERCRRITSSGGMRGDKGDVVTYNISWFQKQLLIECKRRKEIRKGGRTVTLDRGWFPKVIEEAKQMGDKVPLVVFSFYGATKYRKWIAFRENDTIYLNGLKPVTATVIGETKGKGRKGNFVIYYEQAKKAAKDGGGLLIQVGECNWFIISWEQFTDHLLKWKMQFTGR